jgi:hypothetical protein
LLVMLENKKVRIENNKMHTTSMLEILKQAEHYRKMHKIAAKAGGAA